MKRQMTVALGLALISTPAFALFRPHINEDDFTPMEGVKEFPHEVSSTHLDDDIFRHSDFVGRLMFFAKHIYSRNERPH
jgi:hypothetical protein